MRKLAMLSTALLGLASFHPTFAQNQSAPQPGLPPGASVGAVNAQPPAATGQLSTTQTSPAVAPSPVLTPTPAPVATRPRRPPPPPGRTSPPRDPSGAGRSPGCNAVNLACFVASAERRPGNRAPFSFARPNAR